MLVDGFDWTGLEGTDCKTWKKEDEDADDLYNTPNIDGWMGKNEGEREGHTQRKQSEVYLVGKNYISCSYCSLATYLFTALHNEDLLTPD